MSVYQSLRRISSAPISVPLQLWKNYQRLNSIPVIKSKNGKFYDPAGMHFNWDADYYSVWQKGDRYKHSMLQR